jgi:dTMP kinase
MAPFIVIEGLDGAGTTTQTAMLVSALTARGVAVTATREPSPGPIGQIIRRTLRGEPDAPHPDTLPWLFAADRADHLHRVVRPQRSAGTVVISDRYYPSSLAYQSLTMPMERVLSLNLDFDAPTITFWLEVPAALSLYRLEGRSEREIFEVHDKLEIIAARYHAVFAMLEARGERVVRLDGRRPVGELSAVILNDTLALIPTP